METKLARITEVARERPNEKFTSLAHLINGEMLIQCHQEMNPRKAPGVDEVTKAEYEKNLAENVADLVARMKRQAYKPQAVRRTYIPKPGKDEKRPLGIPAYEDKLVQMAVAKILSAVYEADFLDCSFGFRPSRGCHDALQVLNYIIENRDVNYIVDADIKGFFDHVSHQSLMQFLGHRIADPHILRLIRRILKAGVIEAGVIYDTPEGTPQGGVVSPVLANVYLHYALDLWFVKVVRRQCRGLAYIVRYADDLVCCFQYKDDAERFYRALTQRLAMFNLEIAQDKTRIIPFGRNASMQCRTLGRNKPDTFDFLGFTHYCGRSKKGKFRVKRKTSGKKVRASLLRCKEWLRRNRHLPVQDLTQLLRIKLLGYYRYYGLAENLRTMDNFQDEVCRMLFKWLNRRSQRRSFSWDKYILFKKTYPLPRPKTTWNIYDVGPHYLGHTV